MAEPLIRRRSNRAAAAILMTHAVQARERDDRDMATAFAMVAHELAHEGCEDKSMEHLHDWVEHYQAPTMHELAADAVLDPYLDLDNPPAGWHLIDNADADDVRHALEVAIERIRGVLKLAAGAHYIPMPGDDGCSMKALDAHRIAKELRGAH